MSTRSQGVEFDQKDAEAAMKGLREWVCNELGIEKVRSNNVRQVFTRNRTGGPVWAALVEDPDPNVPLSGIAALREGTRYGILNDDGSCTKAVEMELVEVAPDMPGAELKFEVTKRRVDLSDS